MTDDSENPTGEGASRHGASGGPIDPAAAIAVDSDREFWIPPDATELEAAAIAAAIAAYLSERERAAGEAEDRWDGDRWTFAGQLERIGRHSERVPPTAPRDPWTASGRADRF